ncbi:MAG: YaaA family protein [Campylobacteraceae bacterium]|nr:YaaA family protein [Campylobacteraceae bacterium]
MKILFSPSETKSDISPFENDIRDELFFKELFSKREIFIKKYDEILKSGDEDKIKKLFGLKNIANFDTASLFEKLTQKAILRYSGVAYKHLNYKTLNSNEQNFIDENVIIFSNLFGPILAKNKIPNYKLQQGETIDNLKPEITYQNVFKSRLDEFVKDEFIIDLRAEFYEKFYQVDSLYTSLKFLKNGKIVSHFAKVYRGLVLRELAKFQPKNEREFGEIRLENLNLIEIKQFKNKKEYLFEITKL